MLIALVYSVVLAAVCWFEAFKVTFKWFFSCCSLSWAWELLSIGYVGLLDLNARWFNYASIELGCILAIVHCPSEFLFGNYLLLSIFYIRKSRRIIITKHLFRDLALLFNFVRATRLTFSWFRYFILKSFYTWLCASWTTTRCCTTLSWRGCINNFIVVGFHHILPYIPF